MGRHSLPIDFRIAYSITINHWAIRKFPEGNRIITDRCCSLAEYNSVASAEGLQVDERLQ
jgi:hypothetical protein